jgi:superfamily II DNA or RNA helicase
MGLSATPIYNFGGEIFNIMEVLSPGKLGARHEFIREWCSYYGNDKYLLREPDAFGKYLRENFLMIRRTRPEVGMELPPVERVVQTIPYEASVIDAIADVATELAHLILKGSFLESGQAARELDLKLRQATGIAKAPFVAEFVKMLVQDGQPVVLFGWHRAVYDVWLEKLSEFNPVLFTGSETPNQKQASKEAFQRGDTKVMIMSLRSGQGVDGLQAGCNTAVFGELDWSPGIHEQCIGRLNRDGASGNVSAFFLVSDAGSDPLMAEILGLKTAQLVAMVDPDKKDNLSTLQTDADRIKRMARDWLARRGKLISEPPIVADRSENDKPADLAFDLNLDQSGVL